MISEEEEEMQPMKKPTRKPKKITWDDEDETEAQPMKKPTRKSEYMKKPTRKRDSRGRYARSLFF